MCQCTKNCIISASLKGKKLFSQFEGKHKARKNTDDDYFALWSDRKKSIKVKHTIRMFIIFILHLDRIILVIKKREKAGQGKKTHTAGNCRHFLMKAATLHYWIRTVCHASRMSLARLQGSQSFLVVHYVPKGRQYFIPQWDYKTILRYTFCTCCNIFSWNFWLIEPCFIWANLI